MIDLVGTPHPGALDLVGDSLAVSGRLSVTSWGTGAAGGGAAVLRALGARAMPGPRVMAHLLGLDEAVGEQDLVVTSVGEAYGVLADSVIAVVGTAAASLALPAVLVAGRTAIPHGELAEVGIVSAYALESAGAPRDATARPVAWNAGGRRAVRGRLVEMGARLAGSWSR